MQAAAVESLVDYVGNTNSRVVVMLSDAKYTERSSVTGYLVAVSLSVSCVMRSMRSRVLHLSFMYTFQNWIGNRKLNAF